MRPTIIVAAFNRVNCLVRLLDSLERAQYPDKAIRLVISIDRSDESEVLKAANEFSWRYGEKHIVAHDRHLGLKDHILSCGDLAQTHESIILLEDDLVVSPLYYTYACQALEFYARENDVAGVSLYHYQITENGFYPFEAIDDGASTYFMQVPSSWGQAWTAKQWKRFRDWYDNRSEMPEHSVVPAYIQAWSDSSWKKEFARYLIASNRLFVYPRSGLSTNFSDPGTNASTPGLFQSSLQMGERPFRFTSSEESRAVYDAYFELTRECLDSYTNLFAGLDYEIDLYGTKDPSAIRAGHLLTTRLGKDPINSFALTMAPNILNVIYGVQGDDIRMLRISDVTQKKLPEHRYHYRLRSVAEAIFDPIVQTKLKAHVRKLEKRVDRKVTRKLDQYIKQFEFIQNYPLISVVAILKDDRGACRATIRSIIEQDYPNLELIVVDSTNDRDLQQELRKTKPVPIYCTVAEEATVAQALELGFSQVTGSIMGWIEAPSSYHQQSLITVAKAFRSCSEVSWITGIPTNQTKCGTVIEVETLSNLRWTGALFHESDVRRIRETLKPESIFWTKYMWNKCGAALKVDRGALVDIDLWSRFFNCGNIHILRAYLGANGHDTPADSSSRIGAVESDGVWSEIQSDYFQAKPPRGRMAQLITATLRPFFERDVPVLRFLYLEHIQAPDILRFDHDSGSFYPARY